MHFCSALIVSCIDFRIQSFVEGWAGENLGERNYDRAALGGGVKDFPAVIKQIDLSFKLHGIKKVILMNHQDCGAYGKEGTEEIHRRDLLSAAEKIFAKYPHLSVETFYVHLNGEIEEIK